MSWTNTSTPTLEEEAKSFSQQLLEADEREHRKIERGKVDPTDPMYSGLGRSVRNGLNLWDGESDAHQEMWELGFRHPDDMSGVFLEIFRAHVQGESPDLKPLRQKYYEHWAIKYEKDPLAAFCNAELDKEQVATWKGLLMTDGWQEAVDLTQEGTPNV